MRLYLDTEFIEDGRTIDLISIALVSETGLEFYRQNAQADLRRANEWVSDNVLPQLWPCPKKIPGPRHVYGLCADNTCVWRPKRMIRDELFNWVGLLSKPDGMTWVEPEFWGYYADYDWVALCQLFGRMIDLPRGWPMYCRDLKQYADYIGSPPLPGVADEHNALSDARWNLAAHRFLMQYDLSLSQREREDMILARRKESRPFDQKPQGVRSLEEEVRGHPGGENPGSKNLERGGREVVVTQEEYAQALEGVVLGEEGSAFI